MKILFGNIAYKYKTAFDASPQNQPSDEDPLIQRGSLKRILGGRVLTNEKKVKTQED
jgi:hypothetical protein